MRFSPINAAVRPNYQAVEVIDQARVAGFSASDRQIRSGAPVDATKFAHLFTVQFSQRHPVNAVQKFLQPLPGVLAFVNEAIERHLQLSIANFRFVIFELECQ